MDRAQKTHVTCSLYRQSNGALTGPTENISRDATQLVQWRADCCLEMSYNIRPTVAYAYRGVFIEPLRSNALRKSVTIYLELRLELKIRNETS
jgi:hypothetical protein